MKKLIFIDVETTGLDPKRNGIWQISALVEIDGKAKEILTLEMNPGDVEIDKSSIEKCNISKEKLDSLRDQSLAFDEFVNFLDDYISKFDKKDKAFFIGYNANFDNQFVRQWFEKNNHKYFGSYFYSNPIDIYTLVSYVTLSLRDEIPNMRLETMCELFNIELEDAHNSENDIKATYKLFKVIRKEHLKVII